MAEGRSSAPAETWIVRVVGGDTAPFHCGHAITTRQGPGNEVTLETPSAAEKHVGTFVGPHLRFDVEGEKGRLVWTISRYPGSSQGARDMLLGAIFRQGSGSRGNETTGVWVAEAGEGGGPLG